MASGVYSVVRYSQSRRRSVMCQMHLICASDCGLSVIVTFGKGHNHKSQISLRAATKRRLGSASFCLCHLLIGRHNVEMNIHGIRYRFRREWDKAEIIRDSDSSGLRRILMNVEKQENV